MQHEANKQSNLNMIAAAEREAELSRLRAEVERLREALREIAEAQLYYDYIGADETGKISLHVPGSPYDRGKRDGAELLSARARKALEGGE